VIDIVGGDEIVHNIQLPVIPDFFDQSASDGDVLL